MRMSRLCFPLVAVLAFSALAQNVPTKVNFTARMVDNGTPVQGNRDFVFKLFPTIVGGAETWTEARNAVPVNEGAVNIDLGASTPLTTAILDGQTLYLEVTVGGTVLTPRTPVVSVPYAIRSTVAAQVGTLTAAQIQQRVSSACGAGAAIQTINADGTVVCQAVGANDAGVTTITNITAGAGLTGGGSTGNVSLAVNFVGSGTAVTAARSDHTHAYLPLATTSALTCPVNEKVVSINAATGSVNCAVDANTTYGVTANGGVALNGATNQFSLTACAASQILVASGGGVWACAAAPASSVVTGTAPISVTANAVSLAPCAAGEILKMFNGAWSCQPDANSGGTVTAVGAVPPLATSGGANPTISLGGVVPLTNGGTGASLASPSGGSTQPFIKQLNPGAALSSGPILATELPIHRHAGVDINAGVVGVGFGGTGASLGGASGGAGQVVKQTTAGGPLSVGLLTSTELPAGTQIWPALPSCNPGETLRGIGANGAPVCVAPAPADAIFNITANGSAGTYASVYIYCNTASCNIAVPGLYAAGSSPGTVTVTRNSIGNYSVNIPWMNSSSVPQITPYNTPPSVTCRSGGFTGPNFSVLCSNLLP